jgi:hypothetical protein
MLPKNFGASNGDLKRSRDARYRADLRQEPILKAF